MHYLYGIVRAGHRDPACKGVGAPPQDVRFVTSGPIAAVDSVLADDFAISDEDARTHLKVLIALLRHGPVVPLRMGTVAPDEDAIRAEVLDAARDAWVERLDALEGLVELHVDADDDETEAIAAVARSANLDTSAVDLDSRLELGRQVADLLVQRRQQIAEQIVSELRPHAVQDVPRAVLQGPEDPLLRWAFLVRRDDIEDFDQAVVAARSHHPTTTLRYVGPLPPSHFVDWPGPSTADDASPFSASSRWGW